ncbi:MAG TPA: molybdate ABC transporter substrate-binding protein [Gemmataceae bacterium]|nr:molybdate ABC transporter substrate-binding protein [Gemmataceae bacterium]
MRAVVVVIIGLLVAGCAGRPQTPHPTTARVAAAADLRFAFDDLSAAFKSENPVLSLEVTFGASGSFFAQLSEGEPFDVFLSANTEYPKKLVEQGRGWEFSMFTYAVGHLAVWVPKSSAVDIERLGIRGVADPAVRKVAIANPRHAPYGQAAEAALKRAGVYDQVKDRLVLGENVAQAAQLAESRAADIGVIALSLALSPTLREQGKFVEVSGDLYLPLEQGVVILKWAEKNTAAGAFRDFLATEKARIVLEKFGFRRPKG